MRRHPIPHRCLAVFLSLILVLSLLPTTVFASGGMDATYALWVDGTQVTGANATDVLRNGTVSYDAESNTLTLNGADLSTTHTGNNVAAAIFADDSMGTLTVHVTGENSISVLEFGKITAGIYGFQDIVFEGDGSLKVEATSLGTEGNAVYAHTGNVTIQSGTYDFTADGTGSYGIFANSNSGTVFVNGGTLTAKAGATGTRGVAIGGTLDFSQHTGCEITASVNASGTPETTYNSTQQNTYRLYKYIAISPPVVITPEYDNNGFQTNGDGYQPAQLVDGVYQIENAGQLFWFAQQVKVSGDGTEMNAQLVNNITIPEGREWTPIWVTSGTAKRPYTGTFDGAGHTISGLQTEQQHGGLFRSLAEASVVKNLGLVNGSFTGGYSDYVGSIAATNYGMVQNCYNTCPVTGQLMFVGGIVGENKGTIQNCYNTGAVTVNGQGEGGGGICGTAREDAIVQNCYNTGSVSGRWGISGICGYFSTNTIHITNCYNTGTLSIINNGYPESTHGIAYSSNSASYPYDTVADNCYYIAHEANETGGKTQAQFASGEVTWLLNDNNSTGAWGQTLGTDQVPVLNGPAVYEGYEFCYSESVSYSNDSTQVHSTKPAHDFTKLVYDEDHHWYVCANEGCTQTSGTTESHTWSDWVSDGDGHHTRHCTFENCDASQQEDCFGGTATYFEQAVCNACGEAYGSLVVDTTAPTGEITVGTDTFKAFLNQITFGLFFNQTQSVKITADDDSYTVDGYTADKAATIEYYLYNGNAALTKEELTKQTFTPYSGAFTISPDNNYVIYAKITDHAGNVTYISSNGIVLDATVPAITGVTPGSTYYTTQSVTVADANLASVTLNGTADDTDVTLDGNVDQTYTITAKDNAGNTTTVQVTMKPIASLALPIENLTTENVTSEDKAALNAVKEAVKGVDVSHATDTEKADLEEIIQRCDSLLGKVDQVKQDISGVTDAVTALNPDTITSDDKNTVEQLQTQLENLINSGNLTEDEKSSMTDLQDTCDALLGKVDQVAQDISGVTDAVTALNPDTITSADKDDVEQLQDQLENLLNSGNLTQEEKENMADLQDTCDALLGKVDQVAENISGVTDAVNALNPDTITSADKEAVEQLQSQLENLINSGNLTEDEKSSMTDLQDTCDALLGKVDQVAQDISGVTDAVTALNPDTITSADKDDVEQLQDQLENLLNSGNLTQEEKENMADLQDTCDALLGKVDQVAQDISGVTDAVTALNPDTITSADKDTVEQLQDQLENLLNSGNLTEEERGQLQEVEETLHIAKEQLAQSEQAGTTENIENVAGITPDHVTLEDKEDLAAAKQDLEDALNNFAGNYTQEEADALKEQLELINQALESIEQVEDVQTSIIALPESTEPDELDNEALIVAAQTQLDALSSHEKSLLSQTFLDKLESLQADLSRYRIISGDGSQWIAEEKEQGTAQGTNPDQEEAPETSITMVANGALQKFTGIWIDGVEVDPSCYTVASGSTIITLKPEYLRTLSLGEHTLTFQYTNGATEGTFYVLQQHVTSPDTGDHNQVGVWIACLLAAGLALTGTVVYTRKKKHSK